MSPTADKVDVTNSLQVSMLVAELKHSKVSCLKVKFY